MTVADHDDHPPVDRDHVVYCADPACPLCREAIRLRHSINFPESNSEMTDRLSKLRELVEYLRSSSTYQLEPDYSADAFDAVANYIEAIVDGRFEDLPFGVGAP